jgi:putative cell wall-binding protein
VLLTRAAILPADTSRALAENGIKTVYISGGPASVSPAVASQIAGRGIATTRIGGANRYEVAVNLANFAIQQHWGNPTYIGIASGEKFPDALTGGSITGHRGGVLQLTPGARLGTNCAAFVGTWGRLGLVDDCVIYGGPASVSSTTEGRLAGILK